MNAHGFLERCHARGVHIVFVGQCGINKDGNGTNTHVAYTMGTRVQKGRQVTVYWKKELDDLVWVVMEADRVMAIEIDGKRIFGVYGKTGSSPAEYLHWLETVGRKNRNRDGILVGDWNAHHRAWGEEDRENGRGRTLQEWTTEEGYELVDISGPTWERTDGEGQRHSRIDLVFTKGTSMWDHPETEKLTSDHWALFAYMELEIGIGEQVRKVVDWAKDEDTIEE